MRPKRPTLLATFAILAAFALLAAPYSAEAQFWAKGAAPASQVEQSQLQSEGDPGDAAQDQPLPQGGDQQETDLPVPSTPARDAPMPRVGPPPGRAASLGGSGATGPDSVGTLPARDTNFDRNTWRGSNFSTVLRLMAAIPDRIDSAGQHELARNLLVSIADAPAGDDGGSRLLELRVRKLLAMGSVADAASLARAANTLQDNPSLAQAEIEAELLAGQVESACIDLRAMSGALTDAESVAALNLCRQAAGEATDGAGADAGSFVAASAITGAAPSVNPSSSPVAQLVSVALNPRAAPDQRLEAGFAAGRASALTGEFLGQLMQSASGGGVPASAPTDGSSAAGLYHAIVQEGSVDQRIGLAERGLLSPEGVADKISVAMVNPLRKFQPVAELGAVAPRMAMLFYTIGDTDAAAPWAELADSSGNGALLWPYRALLKQTEAGNIAQWQQKGGLDAAHFSRVLTILSAFGAARPPSQSTETAGDDRPEPPLSDLLAMDKAAGGRRTGETALYALALLGRGGPAQAHPLTLKRALADLDQVSLHSEARLLAFEAITATLLDGKHGAGP
jgi:hypothetical protein